MTAISIGRLLLCSAFALSAAKGQTALGTSVIPGSGATENRAGWLHAPGGSQIAPLSNIASLLSKTGPLLQSGPVAVRPHFNYELVHGSGILRIPGKPEKVTMHTISPGILFDVGSHASADYTLSRIIYTSSKLSDSTDHNVRLQAGTTHDEWKFGFSGNYGSSTSILVETGGQTQEDSYSTSGNTSYQIGRRSELEVNFSHTKQSSEPIGENTIWDGADWTLWNTSTWLRYHVSQDLSVAAGVSLGYDNIKRGPDMSHVQPQLQIAWQLTKKLSASAKGGFERRRTRAVNAVTQENGRYSASLNYSPFPTTTVSITASRSIDPSYFTAQTAQSDSWGVSAQQRLLKRFFLSVGASQRRISYDSAIGSIGALPNRGDRYDSFNARMSTPVLRNGSIAVFYQRGRNRSSIDIFAFTSNQVGGQVTYRL